jgi:sugar phosphate isomerase/epimerase
MPLLSRIGACSAICLLACALPMGAAQSSDNAPAVNCTSPAHSSKSYGAQLYTVRAAMEQDFEGTLCRIAQIGYRDVEFAGLHGRDPQFVRTLLKAHNLNAVALHGDWRQLRDNPESAIDEAKALGVKYLVLAWLPPDERQTPTQWRWWAGHLNMVGKMAAAKGVALLYHAHDFEYDAIDGMRPIDLLQEQFDPRFVNFEMDIYWTVKGGGDPIELLRRYPGRFPLVHVKDMQIGSAGMADVGDGRIDFAAIFAAAGPQDFLHKFVERDEANDPFETLRRSLNYLQSIERKPVS